MRQFGLIGYPLTHSFSKKYFTEKFAKDGLQHCSYENYPITSINDLPALIDGHAALQGLNITIPYKEQVIPYLSEQSMVVQQTGACNCIKIRNGRLVGYNTDVIGFERSLTSRMAPHHKNALILGTGGAAKAVEYVLRKLSLQYRYVSRTPSPAALPYEAITPALAADYTLIINTTPLGMFPNIQAMPPLPYHAFGPGHYLYDLVYNPEKTLFLQMGEQQGAVIKNGQDMLLIQADESWKIWNDITD